MGKHLFGNARSGMDRTGLAGPLWMKKNQHKDCAVQLPCLLVYKQLLHNKLSRSYVNALENATCFSALFVMVVDVPWPSGDIAFWTLRIKGRPELIQDRV
jgi:hypothetical protein